MMRRLRRCATRSRRTPTHQPARRLLSEHETAVDVERRLAAALARARDASSTEAAVAALQQALQIAPDHAEARRLLHEAEEDLAREQAEARQLRERQEAEARELRQRQEAIAAAIRTCRGGHLPRGRVGRVANGPGHRSEPSRGTAAVRRTRGGAETRTGR